ncbi:hypothetical protein FOMG_08685 [Fusarium oxysporum f. sp. melonis 26406]|uniref:Uncharacterized protein n=1 Tax=Fusarium oxysporum f. sp. melonis 26406 TaxID=1089452 RepID=X0AZ41_FUSOX|nr:hypothetical protein FOMG_08685 [Fusarium oxysporum f. sp. melonis 26406]
MAKFGLVDANYFRAAPWGAETLRHLQRDRAAPSCLVSLLRWADAQGLKSPPPLLHHRCLHRITPPIRRGFSATWNNCAQ